MKKLYEDDSLTLHTDLYQINMMKTYWETGRADLHSVFECYFRSMPFDNGYVIFAGLERLVKYLEELTFSESVLAYLLIICVTLGLLALFVLQWKVNWSSAMNRLFRWKGHYSNVNWLKRHF